MVFIKNLRWPGKFNNNLHEKPKLLFNMYRVTPDLLHSIMLHFVFSVDINF